MTRPLLITFSIIVAITLLWSGYLFMRDTNNQFPISNEQKSTVLADINTSLNFVNALSDKLPIELEETNDYFKKAFSNNQIKIYEANMKDAITGYGTKTGRFYIDPSINLKPQLWGPLIYYLAGLKYWHSLNHADDLFRSKEYATIVSVQAWEIIRKNYPVTEDSLTIKEHELFNRFNTENILYQKKIEGNTVADEKWKEYINNSLQFQTEMNESNK